MRLIVRKVAVMDQVQAVVDLVQKVVIQNQIQVHRVPVGLMTLKKTVKVQMMMMMTIIVLMKALNN